MHSDSENLVMVEGKIIIFSEGQRNIYKSICSSPIPQKCCVEFKSVSWLAWLFALVSGALITCQVGSNTQLKKSLAAISHEHRCEEPLNLA
jgi:hypothetical protein